MEFSLIPGHSLGTIELGSLLWNVLSILRAEQATFKHVQICWEAGKPATGYLLLSITSPPTRLLFEGVDQRLLLIEAHQSPSHERNIGNSPSLGEWVHYQNQPISHAVGPNEPGVTLRVIHRLFGPTYPPAPHTSHHNEMVVSYPGVTFSFSHEVLSRIILSVQPTGEECKEDEGESVQLTEAYFKPRMPKYMSSIDGDLKSAKIKLGRVDLEESTSITFSFHSSSPNREIADVKVTIGSSTSEDILCEFGAPLRTFWKEDDRMKIHTHLRSNGRSGGQTEDPNPYFMSYFNIGLDFLIDPITNVVLKAILHSNIPGEVLFARYSRCPWSLRSMDGNLDIALSTDKATHTNQQIRASFAQKEAEDRKPEGLADNGKL
ncbi:hypothetical protein PGT21_003165 [Puccinia graminis f. sp. tritici]|nr:hypothetical protein PGT21_004114 [Puccinia graminis f. sp. tritici]KAA1117310.1 hypothetical protein PGT21_003165 [Puccinia graminis f. sp. tritici]